MPPGLSSTYVTTSIDSTVVRRMYLAVVIPAMLFAADTFLTPTRSLPGKKREHGSVGYIRTLARV